LSLNPAEQATERLTLRRQSAAWQLVTGALGISLWVQLFGAALGAQFGAPASQVGALLAYLLPLVTLALGAMWRNASVALFAVPISFLPGITLMPPLERLLLNDGLAMLRVGASLLLYMAAASAGLMADPVPGESQPANDLREGGAEYMRVVYGRAVALLVIFIAPAYAVYADPAIAALLSERYGGSPQVARAFIGMLHFFAWSVLAYMLVLLPVLNLEYDYKQLVLWTRDAPRQWTRAACGRRAGLWSLASLLAIGGFALLR
jgi:hypothetical protein